MSVRIKHLNFIWFVLALTLLVVTLAHTHGLPNHRIQDTALSNKLSSAHLANIANHPYYKAKV